MLAVLCLAGVALAALLGRRTADRFVAVLDRLEQSQAAQRQLVADASHELRTPVTALRTNAEILLDEQDLPPAQQRALLADVVDQTEELSALVADLIELARGDQPAEAVEDVRLDELVDEAVERARRHATHVVFATSLDRVTVVGIPERLGRAVNNLLDNAAKYSPPGTTVEVVLRGGELTVRDHGPGVPPDELPHIFDRFFRATNARERPGSGPRPGDRQAGRGAPRRARAGRPRGGRRAGGDAVPARCPRGGLGRRAGQSTRTRPSLTPSRRRPASSSSSSVPTSSRRHPASVRTCGSGRPRRAATTIGARSARAAISS